MPDLASHGRTRARAASGRETLQALRADDSASKELLLVFLFVIVIVIIIIIIIIIIIVILYFCAFPRPTFVPREQKSSATSVRIPRASSQSLSALFPKGFVKSCGDLGVFAGKTKTTKSRLGRRAELRKTTAEANKGTLTLRIIP